MILLVVLLGAGLHDPVEDPGGEPQPRVDPGQRAVGGAFPRLVGHPGDDLQHDELAQRPRPAVDQIYYPEQQLARDAVVEAGRAQRLSLGTAQPGGGQLEAGRAAGRANRGVLPGR